MARAVVLSDEMWARIEPLLPPLKGAMGRPMTDHRMLVERAAFTTTFGVTRLITHLLRRAGGASSSGGIIVHGRHLHHYNLGILLLAAVGALAVRGDGRARRHPWTAVAYGGGAALVVDEFALLLDLEDVYWARDGRTSVDTAVGTIGLAGLYLAAAPFWHGTIRELLRRGGRHRGPG